MPEDTQEVFENPEAEELLKEAAGLFAQNKLEEAERVLLQVTEKFPGFFPGWASYGDFLLKVGCNAAALAPLRRAVRLAVFDGMGHYLLGVAYLKVARFHLAERELEAADTLLAGEADVKAHLGRAQVMLGKIEQGRALISQALDKEPDNPFIRVDIAQSYVVEKNFKEALRWCESIRSDNPFFKENTAIIRRFKEDFDRLTQKEQEAARRQPANEHNQGRIEMLLGFGDEGTGLTQEDIREITEELRLYGLTGQISIVQDPDSPKAKAVMEFIKMHETLGLGQGRKMERPSLAAVRAWKDALRGESPIDEKKKALVRLANSGNVEALQALDDFLEGGPQEDLKLWAELARDECRLLYSGVSGSNPSVIFRRLEN